MVKRKDVRQAELLDQVLALFLEHGYENVSLNAGVAASYQVKMATIRSNRAWLCSRSSDVIAATCSSRGDARAPRARPPLDPGVRQHAPTQAD